MCISQHCACSGARRLSSSSAPSSRSPDRSSILGDGGKTLQLYPNNGVGWACTDRDEQADGHSRSCLYESQELAVADEADNHWANADQILAISDVDGPLDTDNDGTIDVAGYPDLLVKEGDLLWLYYGSESLFHDATRAPSSSATAPGPTTTSSPPVTAPATDTSTSSPATRPTENSASTKAPDPPAKASATDHRLRLNQRPPPAAHRLPRRRYRQQGRHLRNGK
ncbi:hypothetical protein GCM10020227_14180 [Streptomyces flavovirens]